MKIFLLATILLIGSYCNAQTALRTSFESSEGYNSGNLHTQNGWSLTSGVANVYSTKAYAGTNSANLTASNTALRLDYVKYSGAVPGITGDVYTDIWVNTSTIGTKSFGINGYDLYGGSSKRVFVIEFTADNKIRAFNGSSSSSSVAGTWTANTWVRVSVKVDFAAEKYKVAVNGNVFATDLSFRETYTPTASGTRLAGIKEIHSIRFNHLTDTDVSNTDLAVDSIYVGTTPIADVPFGSSSTTRTITVTQPVVGSIALSPATGPYNLNQSVTATLTVPAGYQNNGWTGDLSGTSLVQNFTVTGNLAFGASVGIDPANPPAKYRVYLQQPANGQITLSPEPAADSLYYKETPVTASISFDACYLFGGWTGALSGTQVNSSLTIQNTTTIGANIVPNTLPSTKRIATTVTEFKNALNAMNPGDTIEVSNGTYNLSNVTISRSGCAERPIFIYAKNKGQVTFNGSTSLLVRNLSYITLSGFNFQSANVSTGIKLENCSYVRITNNNFALQENSSCTWIYIGDTYASPLPLRSGHNRIDHNIFDGKTETGNYIKMDGNIDTQTQYDTINYNWFKNNGPRATNEKECIRVGVSTLSMSSGFTVIEYNLFEDCDGDPEVVSIKSCDNIIRYNTFVRCLGTLSLRHGNRSVAEGNYFFGEGKVVDGNGCGGIRVYGKDHKIINNYFTGLTGSRFDAAICITNGDVFNNSTNLSSHYVPENLVVAHNTMVNNFSNVEIGFDNNGNYNKFPINCEFSNNVITENAKPVFKMYSTGALAGVTIKNNMVDTTGTATIGYSYAAPQLLIANPLLVQPICTLPAATCSLSNAFRVLRLSPNSPAINAATGTYTYANLDNEQQARGGAKDIGADEYNGDASVVISALGQGNVGPEAVPFSYGYTFAGVLPTYLLQFNAKASGSATLLQWTASQDVLSKSYVIEWGTNGTEFVNLATQMSTGANANAVYSYTHNTPVEGVNYYRLKILDTDGRFFYSAVKTTLFGGKNQLVVYPNPAADVVYLGGNNLAGTTARIYNSVGVEVKRIVLQSTGTIKMNVSGLPSGSYYLRVNAPGKATTTFPLVVMQK